MKSEIENLRARISGMPLNKYQMALSKTEFVKLLDYVAELEQLRIGAVSNSEVFEHYGKPFTSGRELWDFLTAHYNFTPKT